MIAQELNQRQSYIQNLELALPDSSLQEINLSGIISQADINKEAGYVDAGSLVSFVGGISDQHRQDVLYSTLLAQLAANKKYDREKDPVKWYGFYREVLENVGWVVPEFNFTKYKSLGATFEMDKVVLEILAAIATQNQIAIVVATMQALKGLAAKDNRLVVFDTQSSSSKQGNFQVSVVTESTNGAIAMNMGALYFTASKNTTRFLWFKFDAATTDLYKGGQGMTLNEQVYSRVRKMVIDKLGDNAVRFVGDIEIQV